MAIITFNSYIDTAGDGSYATDITGCTMSMDWFNGFSAAYDINARDATARLLLRNDARKFSPESACVISGFRPGRNVKITATYSGSTKTLYVGLIDADGIRPTAGIYSERLAEVLCTSFFTRTQDAECFIPYQVNKTADTVLNTIISNACIIPPGGSTITADVGKTLFQAIGDKWGDGVSVRSAMEDTVGREYGRLYLDRSGVLTFRNRQFLLTNLTSSASFADTTSGISYHYGGVVRNKIYVSANPRTQFSGCVLGKINVATFIDYTVNPSALLSFRYEDTANTGLKIGGASAISPSPNQDWTANTAADGSGTDLTSSVSASISTETATRTDVRFSIVSGTCSVWIGSGARIRGTKIIDYGKMDYVSSNACSASMYGVRPYKYSYDMDTDNDMRTLADYLSSIWSTPRGVIDAITINPFSSDALAAQAFTRTIFDRISVSETQTGTAADYFIISEDWRVSQSGRQVTVTWGLEPAGALVYWNLGVAGFGELGVTTTLSPL